MTDNPKDTIVSCVYSSPEGLKEILSQIPEGVPVVVTKGSWRGHREMPVGKLQLHSQPGKWGASFFWTDGKYGEYVWLQPSFEHSSMDPIVSIKILQKTS